MNSRFVAKTFEVTPDLPDFYRASFGSCIFILNGGETSFLLCDMEDCTFIPPYLDEDGKPAREWEDRLVGCNVIAPRTRMLLTPEEVEALGVPDLKSPCRRAPTQTCYMPERCIFRCNRGTARDHPSE
jgi:hypothetical protein